MENYQNILLAVDFFEQSQRVVDKAKNIAATYQSNLSIIHVVDNLPFADSVYAGFPPDNLELINVLMDSAKIKLVNLANELNIAEQNVHLEIGSPKTEIVRVAGKIQADLIVVGSHGRHGLALLLGSTANGVLHHANCDVLAVRLHDRP